MNQGYAITTISNMDTTPLAPAPAPAPTRDTPPQDCDPESLQAELDHLKQHLAERDAHISAFEAEFVKGNNRISELEDQVNIWREKYDRLYDSHIRVQKVNQNLEDKLLKMVDRCTLDKLQLARDIETLSIRLAESNNSIGNLQKENERYKNDMNLAIQLLQCKPDNFVSQKFDSLPIETQTRVSNYILNKAKLNQELISPTDKKSTEKINTEEFEFNISASLMSKILEESVQNTISKHCDTCACINKNANPFSFKESHYSIGTQTIMKGAEISPLCWSCETDVNYMKTNSMKPCNSPLPIKMNHAEPEKPDSDTLKNSSPVYLVKHPPMRKFLDENKPSESVSPSKISLKSNEENLRLVNMKHKEIMKKIGDDLKGINMNLGKEFTIPTMDLMAGHHKLCDRTKPSKVNNNYPIAELNKRISRENTGFDPPAEPNPPIGTLQDNDLTHSNIEKSMSIPNSINENKDLIPKSKSDLNFQKTRVPHNSSVSSNDTGSKTSSNRSTNYGSHSGSNSKVHIGPGPRFCSLRMQAGSKNILLDNAQPDIAPILYTRQSRNLDVSPPTEIPAEVDTRAPINKCDLTDVKPTYEKARNILDMPNDDLMLDKPLAICDKPESGYKSNESAEIIDKLLFGDCPPVTNLNENIPISNLHSLNPLIENNAQTQIESNTPANESILPIDQSDIKLSCNNVKVFNYEGGIKNPVTTKIPTDRNIEITCLNSTEEVNENMQPDGLLINDTVGDLLNPNYNIQIASKNLSEINKKFSRIPNQIQAENQVIVETCQPNKEWKNEVSTEKSSSSLSSDDSAVVLQKQQLMRVAEWVQKNRQMEQQNDFDNSDGYQPSPEDMHHVSSDFPRPVKIEYRPRKGNLKSSHKAIHHGKHFKDHHNTNASQPVEGHDDEKDIDCEKSALTAPENTQKYQLVQENLDVKNSNSDYTESNVSSTTTKSYTKEEFARMEYNVKQFLLKGTRWTNCEQHTNSRRTSSKTETDL